MYLSHQFPQWWHFMCLTISQPGNWPWHDKIKYLLLGILCNTHVLAFWRPCSSIHFYFLWNSHLRELYTEIQDLLVSEQIYLLQQTRGSWVKTGL